MRQLVSVTYNGTSFTAYPGDVLLDAALRAGVGMPHDCRSGICDDCIVRVVSGRTDGGEGPEPGTVRSCEARVLSDIEVETEVAQAPATCRGRVSSITPLSENVLEVAVAVPGPLAIQPGQYVQAEFADTGKRALVPTRPLDPRTADGLVRFHVERRDKGRLSSALGASIKPGHRVDLTGPFGSAYLRRGLQNRLVLVAGGTGFAAIWAIADAALRERPHRSMLLIVGGRTLKDLYMVKALGMMATCPNVRMVVTCEERQTLSPVILAGQPIDYMPPLLARDVVFAAGPAGLVDAVGEAAAVSGAVFYGEAFLPAGAEDTRGWLSRVLTRAGSGLTSSPPKVPSRTPVPMQPRLQALPRPGQLIGGQAGAGKPEPARPRDGRRRCRVQPVRPAHAESRCVSASTSASGKATGRGDEPSHHRADDQTDQQ